MPNYAASDAAMKLLLANFSKVSEWPTMMGLSDMAKYD